MSGGLQRAEQSVVFIGDVALDEYFTAPRWPGIADKGTVKAGESYVGGMVANAACVYAGLGGHPDFISLLGDSPLSLRLCQSLEERGVSTRYMLRGIGMADPRNFIVLVGGDHVVLTVDVGREPMPLGEEALDELTRPGYLYTTLNRAKRLCAGATFGIELLAELRRCGRRTVFDLDVEGFAAADAEFFRGASALILNHAGFERSFGTSEPEAVHRWMAEHEVGRVVQTLGAAGVELYQDERVFRRTAFSVPVVDVTGAGDAFGGALLFGLAHEFPQETTLDLAVAAASRAVTIEGPQGGIASLSILQEFADRQGRPFVVPT